KSVLQLTSTMAPTLPSTTTSTAPSVASRSLSLPALAKPFARRMSSARSLSPSASSRAFLHSIIPAPVALRSAAMSLSEDSAIRVLLDVGALLGFGGAGADRNFGSRRRRRLGRLGLRRLCRGEPRFAFTLLRSSRVAGRLLLGVLGRLLLRVERARRRRCGLG